jgi:hypothetical protein
MVQAQVVLEDPLEAGLVASPEVWTVVHPADLWAWMGFLVHPADL